MAARGRSWGGSGGGSGGTIFTKNAATGLFEATLNGEKFVALPADEQGNAKGQISSRTGTLSGLMSIAGNAGEIAKPTDMQGIVTYTGVQGGARYVGSDVFLIDLASPDWVVDDSGPPEYLGCTFNAPAGVTNVALTGYPTAQQRNNLTSFQVVFTGAVYGQPITVVRLFDNSVGAAGGTDTWFTGKEPSLFVGDSGIDPPTLLSKNMWIHAYGMPFMPNAVG